MTNEEKINRSYRIERLLADHDFEQAWNDIEAELYAEWRLANDPAKRESLHAVSRALARLRVRLESWRDERVFLEKQK